MDEKKPEYSALEMDVKEFSQFENVFTYCNKGNAHAQGCVDVTGSGNDEDGPSPKHNNSAFSGGGSGSGI